jgi:CspA family cold shock protein
MASGTIKRLVKDRGFGFIRDAAGDEFFFHRSACKGTVRFDNLSEGQRVEYEVETGAKGPRAENLRIP